ncbi:MAG TPA: hypothetical protein VFK80_02350 [Limnochordia bacterium]|nr:hypothetical protein [Limnochordia bacterium]
MRRLALLVSGLALGFSSISAATALAAPLKITIADRTAELGIDGDRIDPNPFTVLVTVENVSDRDVGPIQMKWGAPAGLVVAPPSTALQTIGLLRPNETTDVFWCVSATGPRGPLPYFVTASPSDADPSVATGSVSVPSIPLSPADLKDPALPCTTGDLTIGAVLKKLQGDVDRLSDRVDRLQRTIDDGKALGSNYGGDGVLKKTIDADIAALSASAQTNTSDIDDLRTQLGDEQQIMQQQLAALLVKLEALIDDGDKKNAARIDANAAKIAALERRTNG